MTTDAYLLAQLLRARAERFEAQRTLRMVGHAAADPLTPAEHAERYDVEVLTAARRVELWDGVVAKLEAQARDAGETV